MLKREKAESRLAEDGKEGGMQRNIGRRERAISGDEIQFLFLFLVQRIPCQIAVSCSMLQSIAQQVRVLGSGGLQPPSPPAMLPLSASVSRRLPPRSTTSRSFASPSTAPPPRIWIPDRSTIILVLSTVETETKCKTDTETITCPMPTLVSENLQRHNIRGAR